MAATKNERSPRVERRDGGTSSVVVSEDRRRFARMIVGGSMDALGEV